MSPPTRVNSARVLTSDVWLLVSSPAPVANSASGPGWISTTCNRRRAYGRSLPNPPVERPVRGFSDCKDGGSFGALGSLSLVGVALREDELNGWGELVGVVLVVLAPEKNV